MTAPIYIRCFSSLLGVDIAGASGVAHRSLTHTFTDSRSRASDLVRLFYEIVNRSSRQSNDKMRLSQNPPTLLSLLVVALSQTESVRAIPLFQDLGFGFLYGRQYGNCGSENQFTCSQGQGCFTANDVAYCSATDAAVGGGGGYAVYTTTYTVTDLLLRTSTYTSSWQAAAPTQAWAPASNAICYDAQTSCGIICCASTQGCASLGQCTDNPVASSLWSYSDMPAPTITSTYSAPLRPTSGGVSTATVSASTTVPFLPPATASGSTLPISEHSSSGGLSPGAIAGIVIGVIVGIIILLLICFCCIVKAGFDGLLAIFGLGKKKRRTERITTEERYSRHGSAASRRDTHTGWFGRPSRVDESRKKKSSGFGGLGAIGAGLAGLALILGLKRRHDAKKEKSSRSDISSSYYTDSYTGTSASKSYSSGST